MTTTNILKQEYIYAYLNSTASPQNSGWLRDPKIQPSMINKKF